MERYIELDIETIRFEAEDVIVTSNDSKPSNTSNPSYTGADTFIAL